MESFNASLHELMFAKGSDLGPGVVAARAIIIFLVAILFVRLAKKRFIAQATAMDLVMAVILGSTLSRGINGGSSLASCFEAGIAIVVIHRVVSFFSCRSRWFGSLVKGSANVIVRDGRADKNEMDRHDLSDRDLQQEMRLHAQTDDLEEIKLAVLERSGRIGFVKQ